MFGNFGGSGFPFGQPQHPGFNAAFIFDSSGSFLPPGFGQITMPDFQRGTSTKFHAIKGSDHIIKNGVSTPISTRYQCINIMKEYKAKSLEELRWEDYFYLVVKPQAHILRRNPSIPFREVFEFPEATSTAFAFNPKIEFDTESAKTNQNKTPNKKMKDKKSPKHESLQLPPPTFTLPVTNLFGSPGTFTSCAIAGETSGTTAKFNLIGNKVEYFLSVNEVNGNLTQLMKVKEKSEENEMYNVILLGVDETKYMNETCNDNAKRMVIELLKKEVNVNIEQNDILRVTKVGSLDKNNSRPIIVQFRNGEIEGTVLKSKKELCERGIKIGKDYQSRP